MNSDSIGSATSGSVRVIARTKDKALLGSCDCTRDGSLGVAVGSDGITLIGSVDGSSRTVRGAKGYARVIALAGNTFVTGTKTLAVIDVAKGKKLASLSHDTQVATLSADAAGSLVAASDIGGTTAIWSLETAARIAERSDPRGVASSAERIIALSGDGRWLATNDWRGNLHLFSAGDLSRPHKTLTLETAVGNAMWPLHFDQACATLFAVDAHSVPMGEPGGKREIVWLDVPTLSVRRRVDLVSLTGAHPTVHRPTSQVLVIGETLIARGGDSSVCIVDLVRGEIVELADLSQNVRWFAASDDARRIWIASEEALALWTVG